MTRSKQITGLAGWLLICYLAGFMASLFEPGSWYQGLNKPAWTPPDLVFPIVWPVLYTLMGIAAWRVWKKHGFTEGRQPLQWFGLQLGLNAVWSWLFFGMNSTGTAFAEILLLWTAILFTTLLFWKKDRAAALLMVPYLLWVLYAAALNYAIWQLNMT